MNEATIGLIITNVVGIVGAYFVHRQKSATQQAAHDEAIKKLENERAVATGTFDEKLLDTAKKIIDETLAGLRIEVAALREENAELRKTVVSLQKINDDLRHEIAELLKRLAGSIPPNAG